MDRRLLLSFIGLAPLTLAAANIPTFYNPLVANLIKRWKKDKEYTLAVFDTMPEDAIEYTPKEEQMTFAQHFMHLGLINNFYMGILVDTKTYKDFNALIQAAFLLERPDPINLFQPDTLQQRDAKVNKAMVATYIADTFDYVISSLENVSDIACLQKVKIR